MATATQGKVVFIAHPLSGDVQGNLLKVEHYVRHCINEGHHPCCPWYAMVKALDDHNDDQRSRGLRANFAILARCDELWVCGDTISEGVKEEISRAYAWNIPIRYVDLEVYK